jgi:hypothetical protein
MREFQVLYQMAAVERTACHPSGLNHMLTMFPNHKSSFSKTYAQKSSQYSLPNSSLSMTVIFLICIRHSKEIECVLLPSLPSSVKGIYSILSDNADINL